MRQLTGLLLLTCSLVATAYLSPRGRTAPRSVRLALTPLERAIASSDVDAVVDSLDDDAVPCDRALAVAALDKAAAVTPDSSDGEQFAAAFEEARLVRAYQALRRRNAECPRLVVPSASWLPCCEVSRVVVSRVWRLPTGVSV